MIANRANKSKLDRRRLQFSLKALLLVVAVLGVAVGLIGRRLQYRLQQEKKQREITAKLESLGAHVGHDHRGIVTEVTFPSWQQYEATDDDLALLKELPMLERLHVGSSKVTDAGVEHLKGLTRLEWLDLPGTQVTDAGVAHLAGLTNLVQLGLPETQITDAAMVHLRGMSKLELLNLEFTQITDAGLVHLEGLSNLRMVTIAGSKATIAGWDRLQEATPHGLNDFSSP